MVVRVKEFQSHFRVLCKDKKRDCWKMSFKYCYLKCQLKYTLCIHSNYLSDQTDPKVASSVISCTFPRKVESLYLVRLLKSCIYKKSDLSFSLKNCKPFSISCGFKFKRWARFPKVEHPGIECAKLVYICTHDSCSHNHILCDVKETEARSWILIISESVSTVCSSTTETLNIITSLGDDR